LFNNACTYSKSNNPRNVFAFGFHATNNPPIKMAIVTIQEVAPTRRLDSEGDMGMYHTHLFVEAGGGSSGEDSSGFMSRGGSPLSEHPSQPYL